MNNRLEFIRVGDVISLQLKYANPNERRVVIDTQPPSAVVIEIVNGQEGLGIPGTLADGFKGVIVHEHWPFERTLAAFNRKLPNIESDSGFIELLRRRYEQPLCRIG